MNNFTRVAGSTDELTWTTIIQTVVMTVITLLVVVLRKYLKVDPGVSFAESGGFLLFFLLLQ